MQRKFTLHSDRLVVHSRRFLGSEYEIPIFLIHVGPEYGILRKRSDVAGAGGLILASIFTALLATEWFAGNSRFLPLGVLGVLALLCFWTGFRHIRKIEYYMFGTNYGANAFDIARAGPDRERFDVFVQRIIQTIHALREGAGGKDVQPPGPASE